MKKTVFVTEESGYIISCCAIALLENGIKPVVFDSYSTGLLWI